MSNIDCIVFGSLREAFDYGVKCADKTNGSSILEPSNDWTNDLSFDEFVNSFYELSHKPDNLPDLKTITEILRAQIDKHKHHFMPQNVFAEQHDVSGSAVDMGRYVENNPDCMVNFYEPKRKKQVSIAYCFGGLGGEDDIMELMGKVIYCLTLLLKNKGVTLSGYYNGSNMQFYYIPIIKNQSDLVMPNIQHILFHPKAFFRRLGFALKEGSNPVIRSALNITRGGGYGSTKTMTKQDIKQRFNQDVDIVISRELIKPGDIEKTCINIINEIIAVDKKEVAA